MEPLSAQVLTADKQQRTVKSAPIHPKTGAPMPVGRGRPPGSKNKDTILRETVMERAKAATREPDLAKSITPLDVLLRYMSKAVSEAEMLSAIKPPQNKGLAKEHAQAVRRAETRAIETAVCAAPYCHSKLQTIDKTVKKGVVIKVISFKDAPDLEPAPVLTITKDVG